MPLPPVYHAWKDGFEGVESAKVVQLHVPLKQFNILFKKAP